MSLLRLTLAATLALVVATASTISGQTPFGAVVRNDLFAGFAGDRQAFERGMAACEKILAENPSHAEALVWHGSGTLFLAGTAFESGDTARGMDLFDKGVAEMAKAVALEPDNIAVRIPRGATLREATRTMPLNVAAPLLEAARTDYQHTFDVQKAALDRVPKPHPLGELLQALGDIYSRQGNTAEAERYYTLIPQHLPDTEYARRAAQWMQTRRPLPAAQSGCIGCHAGR
jgi:tetratricopeptide (TPR) repeat protein